MSIKLSFACLMLALLYTSCRDSEPVDLDEYNFSDFDLSVIPNTWIHEYNKCERDRMNFRPDGETFLNTWRTRSRLELLPDHSAVYDIRTLTDPYINEEVHVIRGTWTFDPEFNTLEVVSKDGSFRVGFNVHLAAKELLRLSYKEYGYDRLDR